jgi:hypothetical protein
MAQTLKEKLSVKDNWIRLLFMIVFAVVVYWIALILVWIIAAFQFIYTLFVGKPLHTLVPFSDGLSSYIHEIMQFLTYVTEEKPFPFKAWPGEVVKPKKISAKPTTRKGS